MSSPPREGWFSFPSPPRTSLLWESAPGVTDNLDARVTSYRSKAVAVTGLSKLAKGWRKGAAKGKAEDQYQLAYCCNDGKEGENCRFDLDART